VETKIHIRPACTADVSPMTALERQSPTAAHWGESFYRGLFEAGATARIALIAEDEGKLAGFLVARVTGDECELENVLVVERSQRRGMGSKLISALVERARELSVRRIFLEVRESNAAARGLYEKRGFQINGCRRAYYNDPREDAVLYTWVPSENGRSELP
jgi:ribosomal-protein-alanine acetyltransferase